MSQCLMLRMEAKEIEVCGATFYFNVDFYFLMTIITAGIAVEPFGLLRKSKQDEPSVITEFGDRAVEDRC